MPDHVFFEKTVLQRKFGDPLLQVAHLLAQAFNLARGRGARCRRRAASCPLPKTLSTRCNTHPRRCPRAGTRRRCSPRRAGPTPRSVLPVSNNFNDLSCPTPLKGGIENKAETSALSNPGKPTLDELFHTFRDHWADAQGLARRSVEAAWRAGQALTKIKARLPHGTWQVWLKAEKLAPRTARRLMQLARVQNGQIGHFETVDAALKSLPKPEPKTAAVKPAADPIVPFRS